MSKIVATVAINGAYSLLAQAEAKWQQAMESYGPNEPVGFPNTAYYLPVIYGILGEKVEKLQDIERVLATCHRYMPENVRDTHPLPYLAPALDAGMISFFAEEIIEAIRYLEEPEFYTKTEETDGDRIWLGAADDVILRKRGVEFVDGTAPGFAAILGAVPENGTAVSIAQDLQQKNLYVFMSANDEGKSFTHQLQEAGIQVGWPTRLVSFGPDTSSTVFAAGFATRAALSFGGVEPGDYRKILLYNKDRIFAFVLALGTVTGEWAANALGAMNFGFPVITDAALPQIEPSGVCSYEHLVAGVSLDDIVSRAIEVRGLKVAITEVPVPVAYGAAFEGERVRGDDIYLECGGGRTAMAELCVSRQMDEVEDGKITVVGPEIGDVEPGSRLPMAILVEVAGRTMQEDYEPILERQIHHLINYAQGVMHIGQRDIAWLRVSKGAVQKGFLLKHIGDILHARLHQDFGRIFDKLQVTIFTDEAEVTGLIEKARVMYHTRDERIEGMTDETVDTFYSCTLCQSFAPSHVCIVSPERTGLCGSYNWMDCRASYEINPTGPNQPVKKGTVIDEKLGQWQGVNEFLFKASRGKIDHYNLYSIVNDPMTTCGCCECIASILPLCNGVMTVNRDYTDDTPCGMRFTTLAGTIGGGLSTPGFFGHSKYFLGQRKYISGDGGILRLVWMPKMLKEEVRERLRKRAEELGFPDFVDMIADETIGTSEEEILPFLEEKGHPALTLDPLLE